MKKIPFGIFFGVSAIIAFYAFAAFFGIYYVFASVANQTGEVVSPFASWWQILLFIVAVIALVGLVVSLVFYFLKKKRYPKEVSNHE